MSRADATNEPYTAFQRVKSSVLLCMVMEGRWNDCDVALFDDQVPDFLGYAISVARALGTDARKRDVHNPPAL